MTASPGSDQDLAGALVRAAEALRLTRARLSRVETAVAEILLRSGQTAASHLADVQQLDLSAQDVSAVAEFLDQLARRTPGDLRLDVAAAARPLPLRNLAAFLSGKPTLPSNPAGDDEGDIFFAPIG
jgi:predicted short-subunit dehydrogenase-like oxidoreductase (DUF2520 family)